MADQEPKQRKGAEPISVEEFLTRRPPGTRTYLSDMTYSTRDGIVFEQADLSLHCTSEDCGGKRRFEFKRREEHRCYDHVRLLTFHYECRNCASSYKAYAILIQLQPGQPVLALKVGEFPNYGPPIPDRLLGMFGEDREYFLKGYQCEKQNLGIAAFSYYRRVVEDHWKSIIGEIVKVAERTPCPAETVTLLNGALNEDQFKKAVDTAKGALPPVLLIDSHNPLTLLHSALSDGLHARSDDECLGLAETIRVVLADLAERVGMLLKDDAELRGAVSRLLNRTKRQGP